MSKLTAILQVLQFLADHAEAVITTGIPVLLAILKLTSWGRANQKALLTVLDAIERSENNRDMKADVSVAAQDAGGRVQSVIQHGVDVVDPKKTPESFVKRLAKELVRLN